MSEGEHMPTDIDLMIRTQAGDKTAFHVLYGRFEARVRARAMGIVREEAAADDVAQEVFLRLWTRAEQWEGRGSVGGWLLRMATNLALNHLRAARTSTPAPERPTAQLMDADGEWEPGAVVDPGQPPADEMMERSEESQEIRRMLGALPDAQRTPLLMVHELDLDLSEVAERLGVPVGTVKSRLHYARERLLGKWLQMQDE
jgi:RNA polymerase sigma-70 factor, ECF subfamily